MSSTAAGCVSMIRQMGDGAEPRKKAETMRPCFRTGFDEAVTRGDGREDPELRKRDPWRCAGSRHWQGFASCQRRTALCPRQPRDPCPDSWRPSPVVGGPTVRKVFDRGDLRGLAAAPCHSFDVTRPRQAESGGSVVQVRHAGPVCGHALPRLVRESANTVRSCALAEAAGVEMRIVDRDVEASAQRFRTVWHSATPLIG